MITIEALILSLIICCPRHELNRDAELRSEVAGYFEAAGDKYDIDPTLMVYWAYRESSLKHTARGKLKEVGYAQANGVKRKTCMAAGHDATTRKGGAYCMALLFDMGRRRCGSLERGLVWYSSKYGCKGSPKARALVKRRLKKWMKLK